MAQKFSPLFSLGAELQAFKGGPVEGPHPSLHGATRHAGNLHGGDADTSTRAHEVESGRPYAVSTTRASSSRVS
eukprot:5825302-Pyramimonas_sp.AAC.1